MAEATPSMKSAALRTFFTALIALVLLTVFRRRYWSDAQDPFKCTTLLNEGCWLDALESNPWRRPWQIWQPPACLLHEYKADDLCHCAGNRQMVFAGDSTVRQLFWSVAKKLDYDEATLSNKFSDKHRDIAFKSRGVTLRFLWDPYLNSSVLANELEMYQDNVANASGGGKQGTKEDPAVMIVIGAGLWHARHFQAGAVRHFKTSLDNIINFTQKPDGSTWKPTTPFSGIEGIGDQVFFIPIEEPVYTRLSPARQLTILPEEVDQMNDQLHQLDPSNGLNIPWVFPVMTTRRKWAYEESGLHVLESIANRRADVILNLRCNAKVDRAIGSPYERTCCSNYTAGNWFQWLLVLCALALLPMGILWSASRTSSRDKGDTTAAVASLAIIALALCYCFVADRTQLFSKVHKLYNQSEFLSLCGIVLAFGIFSIRKSKEALQRKDANDVFVQSSPAFLSRDQTDEWKGWMQAIILIYCWTGASNELWLYIVIRLLVGSYLFLTGYGHAMFFYEKGDYSIRRVAAVLIRLNLLAVALSYQMYTNYLFYYFAPLVSFWFLVIYCTFRFGRELNTGITFLLGKILFSASVTALVHSQREPLDFIFLLLQKICGINWDSMEWRFRVALDGYIVYVGVLIALLHIWVRSVHAAPQFYRDSKFGDVLLTLFPFLRFVAIVASIIILPGFWAVIRRSPDKDDYNWWQPIIAPLPILSFVVLRNSSSVLRGYHSAVFAWLGRCSMETFTLQYHIWMAADTKGTLSLGIFDGDGSLRHDRWRETILITPIFLWTSWQVSSATAVVTKWFVAEAPSDRLLPSGIGKRKETRSSYSLIFAARLLQGGVGVRFGSLLVALWLLNLATA